MEIEDKNVLKRVGETNNPKANKEEEEKMMQRWHNNECKRRYD